jgi:UDPglucose--hexose-1-phosphate uridylyltransferase
MAINEFRKDLVSGEWVLISSARAKRPHEGHRDRLQQAAEDCVFEPHALTGQVPVRAYDRGAPLEWQGDWNGSWTTVIIPNKFPALTAGVCGEPTMRGPIATHPAHGFHELVITRDHDRHFAHFSTDETAEVLRCYRDRYRQIAQDDCGDYISIFHNHGRASGASVYHNHSQIISTPVVPPEVMRSLEGADHYFQQHGTGVHQALIDWEMNEGSRIVYENAQFVVFCPFVSKAPYEMRVFPKVQQARFEASSDDQLRACADALNVVLKKLHGVLDDVDYNFYIHTAPVVRDPTVNYDYYHWHLEMVPREVMPRMPLHGGFELSTAIHINVFDPDDCAQHLRDTKI